MVYASHVIFCAYGFWLPNDPRGSWSDFVGSWELYRFGPATKVDTRASLAAAEHNRRDRLAAKLLLKHPAVSFNDAQINAIAAGFAESLAKGKVICWACSILSEHVHMVRARHQSKVETLVNFLKGAATRKLLLAGLHPFQSFADADGHVPRCWAENEWKVFLDCHTDIECAIPYVENNPVNEGRPRQHWPFVQPFV
jgi:REP element-mobilizing transposase RayT